MLSQYILLIMFSTEFTPCIIYFVSPCLKTFNKSHQEFLNFPPQIEKYSVLLFTIDLKGKGKNGRTPIMNNRSPFCKMRLFEYFHALYPCLIEGLTSLIRKWQKTTLRGIKSMKRQFCRVWPRRRLLMK